MTKSYQIVPPPGSFPALDPKRVAELLANDGQLILPCSTSSRTPSAPSMTSSTSWAAPQSKRCCG